MLKYYQVCSNNDPGLTLTYFMAMSNLSPMLLYGKKVKQWIFQKLVQSVDVKVGRYSQLNEYMKLFSPKGQGHSLTLVQISRIQYF